MVVMKKFLKAVKKGDEGQVTRLLNAQPLHSTLLEKATSEGKRPLAVAIEHGQLGMVRLLVRRGANLSATDRQDKAALHLAASMGHEEVVSFLLSQEAQATTVAKTPLMLASEKGHLGVVQLLVQHREGQGLDERDKGGWTALHWAAHEGHAEVINFLLSKGTRDGNTADSTRLTPLQLAGARDHNTAARTMKVTPLQLACQRGHVGVVQELVQHWGERALHELGQGTQAALQWALNGGHEELVAFLLRTGMKLSKVFTVGKWTPLMMACMCNHLGVVKVLVQHMRAHELERTDDEGMTALHLAAVLGRPEVAAFLLSQGAQANSTSKSHKTPLMHASIEGHLGVVRAFVQHQGAYGLHNTDERGMTALHWAALNGHEEVTKRLLLAGADPNRTDSRGMTARAFAVVRGHTTCVAAFEVSLCQSCAHSLICYSMWPLRINILT
jgi:ankyrin repeat protein